MTWSLVTNGESLSLEGRDIRLILVGPRGDKRVITNFEVDGDKIKFLFAPSLQEQLGLGRYSLTYVENNASETNRTVSDAVNFMTLVSTTDDEDPITPEPLEVEDIDVRTSYIEIGVGGGSGEPGKDGVGILSIVQTTVSTESLGENVMTITLTNGREFTFSVRNGAKGDKGDAYNLTSTDIALIAAQARPALDDVLDPDKSTNDQASAAKTVAVKLSKLVDAIGGVSKSLQGKQDAIADLDAIRSSASKGYTAVQPNELNKYVQKDGNKVLSDNNYTNADKQKVANALTEHQSLAGYAKTTDIPTTLPASDVSEWAKKPNKPTYTASEVGALPSSTTIPTKTSQLQNDSNYLTEHQSLADYEKVVGVINISEGALSISVDSQTRDTDYKCGVLNSLSVTSVTAINKEVNVFFSTGDSVENMPSIPADAKVVGEIELNINKSYVMSIYQGVICCQEIK